MPGLTGRAPKAYLGLPFRRPMLETVRKSIRMLPADRRWWWAALPVLAALTAAAEAVAAGAVFGLVKIIANPQAIPTIPVAASIVPHLP